MQKQNIIIFEPNTTEQENALKAFGKALKLKFEVKTKPLDTNSRVNGQGELPMNTDLYMLLKRILSGYIRSKDIISEIDADKVWLIAYPIFPTKLLKESSLLNQSPAAISLRHTWLKPSRGTTS